MGSSYHLAKSGDCKARAAKSTSPGFPMMASWSCTVSCACSSNKRVPRETKVECVRGTGQSPDREPRQSFRCPSSNSLFERPLSPTKSAPLSLAQCSPVESQVLHNVVVGVSCPSLFLLSTPQSLPRLPWLTPTRPGPTTTMDKLKHAFNHEVDELDDKFKGMTRSISQSLSTQPLQATASMMPPPKPTTSSTGWASS